MWCGRGSKMSRVGAAFFLIAFAAVAAPRAIVHVVAGHCVACVPSGYMKICIVEVAGGVQLLVD